MSDITHIITCLYKFSTTIRNAVPRERLHKIALIDVSLYKNWDIIQVQNMFCPVYSSAVYPLVPIWRLHIHRYLIERLAKANTRRRQLLEYYEAYHKNLTRHIDNPLASRSTMEGNELIKASKLVTSTEEAGGAPAEIPATVYTTTESPITESTLEVERGQAVKTALFVATNIPKHQSTLPKPIAPRWVTPIHKPVGDCRPIITSKRGASTDGSSASMVGPIVKMADRIRSILVKSLSSPAQVGLYN